MSDGLFYLSVVSYNEATVEWNINNANLNEQHEKWGEKYFHPSGGVNCRLRVSCSCSMCCLVGLLF